jgi:hypothetical protein
MARTIPIPFDLLEDLTRYLVVQDGNIDASLLAGRLIAAKVAVDPTIAQIAEQPEGQRAWDVTGWDVGEVNEIVFQNRKGVEPAKLHIRIRDEHATEISGYDDGESCMDGETPYVALVIGYDPPPRVVEPPKLKPKNGVVPYDDGITVRELLDLPNIPDPNTEQS